MENKKFETFLSAVKEVQTLSSIGAVLSWDQETQMPAKGSQARAEQLALISGLAHEKIVSDSMGEMLERFGSDSNLSEDQRVIVRETRRTFDREKKLPKEMVEELARTQSLAHEAWVEARKKSDFPKFAPWLEKLLSLRMDAARKIGGLSANASGEALYDVLLDEFEPGAKSAEITPVFSKLRTELLPVISKIKNSSVKPPKLEGHFAADLQKKFGLKVATDMGFDFEAGRLDVSTHPFCTSFGPRDVRITTRYDESDFTGSLFGIIHETGHALYEQGFLPENTATPLAQAVSMGIHESQSRMWENIVGRSKSFWRHYYPMLKDTFSGALKNLSEADFYKAINVVEPTLIRTESDEVTYNLHILLRYEIETGLFSKTISLSDLPKVWNKKMEEYLGITPPDDANGVLQDIHWSMGAFGYFPTYALGNLYAAQFFATASREINGLDASIAGGNLLELRRWLGEKIHRHGMRYRAQELCQNVTGEKLNAQHFMKYINTKFGEIYKF